MQICFRENVDITHFYVCPPSSRVIRYNEQQLTPTHPPKGGVCVVFVYVVCGLCMWKRERERRENVCVCFPR